VVCAQTNLLTLADARNLAFAHNWDLLAAQSGVDNATAQLLIAKEFPNPTASLSTFKIGSHEAGTALGNGLWDRSYDTIAAVSQLIEIAGKRRDRQEAGRAGVLGAKARFFDAKRTLDQGVTKAYLAVLLAAENERVLTESAGLMRHEANIAEAQLAAGDLSAADTKTLEINAEQFELQAKSAAAATVQARIAVEVLLGADQPRGNWRAGESLEQLATVFPTAPPAGAQPGAARPDVLAAEADLEGGQAELKLQKAIRIPDPTVSFGYEHNPPGGGPAVDTLNIGISFPLPLWNLNQGNIKSAQAAVAQFQEALGKIHTQAVADAATAESEYDEAVKRWQRYRDEIAPQSAKVRESVAFKYEKGAATLVDLLNAEQTDNTIRLALVQSINDTASAIADLTAARTVLSDSDLKRY
jgi:cobalt-zinc-cadmium efflux system outer membrane protein